MSITSKCQIKQKFANPFTDLYLKFRQVLIIDKKNETGEFLKEKKNINDIFNIVKKIICNKNDTILKHHKLIKQH